ncbi:hypothetical protein CPB84DRAFT_1776266 [Gymnopilus junonius]|uniref:Uncharacterized protein n=1 Tax=Gymnopilus junonius TaxID=109634 RepID=A0A9P5NPS5_GYMJU|nr:hypothetical protein CPB84DRAFT_1776266 [Gymnopilus junonius]
MTKVRLHGHQIEECVELLKRAPLMADHTFEMNELCEEGGSQFSITDSFVHHNLSRFEVVNGTPLVDLLLAQVTIPRFEESACHMPIGPLPVSTMQSLFRFGCYLRKLVIHGANFKPEDDLTRLLQSIPTLHTLNLIWLPISIHSLDKLLKHLSHTSTWITPYTGDFLPELCSFSLRYEGLISWELVLGIFGPLCMVQDVCRRPLQNIEIGLNLAHQDDFRTEIGQYKIEYVEEEVVRHFISMVQAGACVKIGWTDPNTRHGTIIDLLQKSMDHHGILAMTGITQ